VGLFSVEHRNLEVSSGVHWVPPAPGQHPPTALVAKNAQVYVELPYLDV
jgi:hypothetical protein